MEDFTADELQEIINLCSYTQQTGLSRDDDEVWISQEAYQRHIQRKERVATIKQKASELLQANDGKQ